MSVTRNEAGMTQRPLSERLRWGAAHGAGFAVALIGLATAGAIATRRASLETVGLGLPAIAALYLFGCTVGGGIVGALLPMARHLYGLVILCIVAVLPLGFATFWTAGGFRWDSDATLAVVIWAPVFGAGIALIWARIRGLPK